MLKKVFIILLVSLFSAEIRAEHKIRISFASGYALVNDLSGNGTFSAASKLTLAYPITPKEKDFNIELGVLGLYEAQLTGSDLRAPGFGFGIRIFYNNLVFMRPYFNHEILTRIVMKNGRDNSATSYSILLGLGADFPLDADRIKESHSIFVDLSYVFYSVGYFDTAEEQVKSPFLTLGYELPF